MNLNSIIHCGILNTQSLCNKFIDVFEHVSSFDIDILFTTETWLKQQYNNCTAAAKTYGYTLYHQFRQGRRKETGGGVGILVNTTYCVEKIRFSAFQTFEHYILKLNTGSTTITLVCIYRLSYEPIEIFFDEFRELLESLATFRRYIIAGDINIQYDMSTHQTTIDLCNLLDDFNLKQLVKTPTQRAGHILDVLLLPKDDTSVISAEVIDTSLSDHSFIKFDLMDTIKSSFYKTVHFRHLKNTEKDAFCTELHSCLELVSQKPNLKEKVHEYKHELIKLIDKHAPLKDKQVKIVEKAPWFDNEYANLRKKRRKFEKIYLRTRNLADRNNYLEYRKQTTMMSKTKKKKYYIAKLQNAHEKQKSLFAVVSELTDSTKKKILPKTEDTRKLANDFLNYFECKIKNIRKDFEVNEISIPNSLSPSTITKMEQFREATMEELETILKTYAIKTSPVDPLNSKVLQTHIDMLKVIWLEIVNLSLKTGSLECLTSAILTPILKGIDDSIDPEIFKNYRPISNLEFLSKLIERFLAVWKDEHLDRNLLNLNNQYG